MKERALAGLAAVALLVTGFIIGVTVDEETTRAPGVVTLQFGTRTAGTQQCHIGDFTEDVVLLGCETVAP